MKNNFKSSISMNDYDIYKIKSAGVYDRFLRNRKMITIGFYKVCECFRYIVIILCLSFLSPLEAYSASYEDYKTEAQSILNSSSTNINSSLSQTEDQLKETVHEDITSNPKEAKYANGGDMESDARSLANESESAKLITNSYTERPNVEVKSTDSFLQKANFIESSATNSNYIIDSVTSEYPECTEQKPQTSITKETKACNEYIETNNTNCYVGNQVALNNKTKYTCSKIRETSNKTCTKTLTTKCLAYKECSTNGLILDSIDSDMKWSYNYPELSIGRGGGNYWGGSCATYDRTINFTVNSLDMIEYMNLYKVGFDDYMSISINDHIIYVGPHGGNTLYTNGRSVFNGFNWGGCELGRFWGFTINNTDLKPYLKQGQNTLKMRVIVAGTGQGWMKFRLKNKCCTTVSDVWEETCKE